MESENVKLILDKATELVNMAGGKIEAFYPYLVKQALIAGYLSLLEIGIAVLSFSVFLILYLSGKAWNNDTENITKLGILTIFCFVVFVIFFILATAGNGSVLAVFNPDYYAVRLLLDMVKQ